MPAFFEPDSAGIVHPATPEKRSAIQMNPLSPNIFRFKTETRRSMHSLSPFGFHDVVIGVHHSPVKAPQKVRDRSPYKVLDATALQDDLYSNFVDWSSHNVLVVGLGNFVYLWNACSSKDGGNVSSNGRLRALKFLGPLEIASSKRQTKVHNIGARLVCVDSVGNKYYEKLDTQYA